MPLFMTLLFTLVVTFTTTTPTFAQETDQDMPVGAVGGSVHADLFTGTATTSIPIEVPPGRGGVQPSLALVYGSANGNGWVGMGWKLEKGVIERQTKHGVDYSGDDYVFRLSGINVELVNVGTEEYRAKIEGGFTKVEKLTATDGKPYFMATDKTGKKFYFGQAANTRVADPNDANNIFRWCLDRVEDTNGNYMTLSYTGDQGQAYQARIDYTGHGSTAPSNSVIFHLEDRPDGHPMYTTHFSVKTAKRLKTIEVQANGNLVRAYSLTYTISTNTNRSLLSSVQQFGKDASVDSTGTITGGVSLPPVSIGWQVTGANISTTDNAVRITQDNWRDTYKVYPGDFNGDGFIDLYLGGSNSTYFCRGPEITTTDSCVHITNDNWRDTYNVYPGDFNGDGITDLYLGGSNSTYFCRGPEIAYTDSCVHITNDNWRDTYNVYPGDYNGDGITDLYLGGNSSTYFCRGPEITYTDSCVHITNDNWRTTYNVYPGDYNGDGITDLYLGGSNSTYFCKGPEITYTDSCAHITNDNWRTTYNVYPGDYNGDGTTDLYLGGSNETYFAAGGVKIPDLLTSISIQ